MKIVFTRHSIDKLKTKEIRALKITQKTIKGVLKNPSAEHKKMVPFQSLGTFTEELSLCVIWKVDNGVRKVITFYPAEKGRYERKL